MKAASIKDYFAILGVEPTAGPEEIRKAYLDRAREIHPDRFDFRTQPVEWRRANDELALLNEAYAALRDSDVRASDEPGEQPAASSPWPSGWDRAAADSEAQDAFAFDLGEMTAGEAAYDDLPRATRERLKARQAGLVTDQLQIRYRPHLLNYAAIGLTLCWFLFLFFQSAGSQWGSTTLMGYTAATVAAGLLMGRNLAGLLKWFRSSLKPCLYLTPLYVIRTHFDLVSFVPVWTVDALSAVGSGVRSPLGGFRATLKWELHTEELEFSSRKAFEEFESRFEAYRKRFRDLLDAGRYEIIREQDDFYTVRRRSGTIRKNRSRWFELSIFGFSLLVSLVVLGVAMDLNMDRTGDSLVRHPAPVTTARDFSAPGASMTLGGAGEGPGGLPALDPPTAIPDHSLGLIPMENPLKDTSKKHLGDDPTASLPKDLLQSHGTTKGSELPHGTSIEDELGTTGLTFKSPTAQLTPANGRITRYHNEEDAVAPFKISLRDDGQNAFVTMEEWETKRPALNLFIHGGRSVEIKVPLGSYRLKYVLGKSWYGEEHLFGRRSVHGELSEKVDFSVKDDKIMGHTLEIGFQPRHDPQ